VETKNNTKSVTTLVTLFILLMSVVISVYSFTVYNPIKVCVDKNTVVSEENRKNIVELKMKEEARLERDKWMKETLQEMSEQIKDIYERGRYGTSK